MNTIKIHFKYLFFFIGCISAYFWIIPVTSIPGLDFEMSFSNRIIRTIYPLFLFFFSYKFIFKKTSKNNILIFTCLFFLLPVFILMFLFSNYLLTIYLPIFVSFFGLIILSVLSKNNFYYWYFGASFISFIFFFLGITKFGFEPTTFYGRPRVHFGFIHPVQTSSIIIGAFSFLVLLTNRIKNRIILKTIAQILIYIFFAIFLFLAQSSNLFIGFHIVILLFFIFKWKNLFVFKKFILLILLTAPFLTLLLLNLPKESLELLDDLTSGRLLNYKQLMFENLANENILTILIGPTNYLRILISNNDVTGFASRDSVYLSFLLSFGFLGLFALIFFLFLIGNKLIKINDKSFSVFCGVIFIYIADAQGLTPNNLIIYSGLAFTLNQYINRSKLTVSL